MNTSDIHAVLEAWWQKNHIPISINDLAKLLAHRLKTEIGLLDLRDFLNTMIEADSITESLPGMFQIKV